MKSCSVLGCHNVANKESGMTLHSFPKNESLRDRWIAALQLSNFQPSDNSFVCSMHFENEDFNRTTLTGIHLKKGVVPSKFLNLDENLKKEDLEIKDEPMDITENISFNTSHLNPVIINNPLYEPMKTSRNEETFIILKPVDNKFQNPHILMPGNFISPNGHSAGNQLSAHLKKNCDNALSSSYLNVIENPLPILQLHKLSNIYSINRNPIIVKTAKYKVNVKGITKCKPVKLGSRMVEHKDINEPETATKSVINVIKIPKSKIEVMEHKNKNTLKASNVPELPPPLIEETKIKDITKCLVIEKFSGYFILDGFNDIKKNTGTQNLRHILNLIEILDDERKKFKCKLCSYQCAVRGNVISHIKAKHKNVRSYKCHYCEFETSFKLHLEDHTNVVHIRGY